MSKDRPAGRGLPRAILWPVLVYLALTMPALGGFFLDVEADSAPGAAAFWLNRAYGYWAAVTFVLLQVGVGRTLLGAGRLRDCREEGLAGWLVCFTAGSFASYAALAALSLAGALGSFGVPLFLGASAVVGLWGLGLMIAHARSRPSPDRPAEAAAGQRWVGYLAAVLAAAWAVPYLLQTFLPNTDWDGAAYHLPLAGRLLREGLWATEPTFPGFNYPGAIHLFYACFLRVRAESAIIPLNFIASCGAALAAYALAERLWHRRAGLWAASICLATNLLWELGLDPRIDGFLAFYCAMACLAVLLWVRQPRRGGLLVLAGMAAGLAAGAKYNALLLLGPLGISAAVLAGLRIRRRIPGTAAALALAAGVVLLPSGLWYLRNAIRLSNPIYPIGRGRVYHDARHRPTPFRPAFERLSARMLPPERMAAVGRETILGVDLAKAGDAKGPRTLLNVWDVIVHPSRYARKPYHWISPLLLLFLILPLWKRDAPALWLYGVGMSALVMSAVASPLLRYAVFTVPVMAVGAGLVLSRCRWRPCAAAFALVVAVQLGWNTSSEWGKLAASKPLKLMTGQVSRMHWLAETGYNKVEDMAGLALLINAEIRRGAVPRDTIFFMIGEAKGGDLLCRHIPDSSREGYPWLVELMKADGNLDRLAQSFRRRRIGYIIFNQGYLDWCLHNAKVRHDELTLSLHTLRQFLRRHARPIEQVGGVVVFGILARPAGQATALPDGRRLASSPAGADAPAPGGAGVDGAGGRM